ncbi:tyrosine-type recombinase/integrase [Larkinella terrae]|uniref:Tyrosine-type recombinase/integrase n=1 Tax=Larkinella terrae TaxID=2025311 RepID=A0A7K0EH91_9BACT|nr:tyrosine-type recombinase/integrase [Larkinella terrae]MRS61210.1 tyrosine-type recombinase/integrase [Larkinella terrae]
MPRTADTPVTYLLRDPKAKTPTPINAAIRFENQRINIGTGFKVLPAHWNSKTGRVKNVVDAIDKDAINKYLKNTEEAITAIITDLKADLIPLTKEKVKERVDAYLNPVEEAEKPKTLLDFVQWYIDTCPTRLVRGSKARTGRFISPDTIRRYKTTLNGLEAFAQTYPRSLVFENIDSHFYKAFTQWLTARNYATNNVSKYIENVKGFMSAAVDEGFTTNLAFRKFANLREEAENIYLTETELQRIYELDLSKTPRLEKVRDLFIFAAWTGLRFSDFSTLQPEHIKKDEDGNAYLDLRQRKTGGRVQIPIVHEAITQLLAKYNNHLPTGISNQRTNDYLKEICQAAEINDRILKHVTKGGKQVVRTSDGYSKGISSGIEKWQLVTTHTGRRSFATNMFKRGMPTVLIMKLTGHKKESEFLKYIKIDAAETLDLMRQYLGGKKNIVGQFPS